MARQTADTGIPEKIEWEVGKTFEGYYFSVQHGIPSVHGDFSAATLVGDDGNRRSMVLTVDLKRGIDQAPLGSRVWITYDGKESLPGGKAVKRFTVEYDAEDRIEVPAPSAVSAPAARPETAQPAYDDEPFSNAR